MLAADVAHIAGLIAGGAHPSPVGARRRDRHDDAQDAARAARGDADELGRARVRRSTGRCSRACRAGRTTTRSPRSRSRWARRRSRLRRLRAGDRGQRPGAGRRAARARVRPRLGRDRQPPAAGRPDEPRVGGRPAAEALERAGLVLQLQRGAVRPAPAAGPVRHPARDAGGDHARPGRGGDARDRAGGSMRRVGADEATLARIHAEVRELAGPSRRRPARLGAMPLALVVGVLILACCAPAQAAATVAPQRCVHAHAEGRRRLCLTLRRERHYQGEECGRDPALAAAAAGVFPDSRPTHYAAAVAAVGRGSRRPRRRGGRRRANRPSRRAGSRRGSC